MKTFEVCIHSNSNVPPKVIVDTKEITCYITCLEDDLEKCINDKIRLCCIETINANIIPGQGRNFHQWIEYLGFRTSVEDTVMTECYNTALKDKYFFSLVSVKQVPTCEGCLVNASGQKAHMGENGCLGS
jgi:hypothetical protein